MGLNSSKETKRDPSRDVNDYAAKSQLTNPDPSLPDPDPRKPRRRTDCPVDKDVLGRCTWTFMHSMAADYPDRPTYEQQKDFENFLIFFGRVYPRGKCRHDYYNWMIEHPPAMASKEALSEWMCRLHNHVNERLGKPTFDCSRVMERWAHGWKDGSCK
ncbi:gfer protein [Aphelenchoides avenae]|nr:gfer protein [Aphelenchus avenae]